METIPCPGCRTDLDPSATVCPICLRPRGKLEITRAYATLRELEKQRKKRPFVIAGRLLGAAALGGLVFHFHQPILAGASSAYAYSEKLGNDLLYPPTQAAAPLPPSPSEERPAPATIPDAPRFQATTTSPPAAATPAAALPAPAPRKPKRVEDLPLPAFDPATQWVFYGRAFDLITLRPVANASLSLNASSGFQRTGTDLYPRTDEEGRFAAVLRRLPDGESYEIRASGNGYASSVLYESDIPYATLPLADRREMVRNAQDGDMTLPPLTDVAGEASVRRDIFLAPTR